MNKGFTVYVSPLEMDSTAHRLVELPMEQEKLDALQLELNTGSPLYTEVSDFCGREYLEEHLPEDMDLTELNLLAEKLASLEPVQEAAFEGLVRMDLDKGMTELPLCRLVDLANSADCCHVAPGVGNDEQLGHFYVDNDFPVIPPGLPEEVYEVLDYPRLWHSLSRVLTSGKIKEDDRRKERMPILQPLESMERISRQALADDLDTVLERISREDIGLVITEEGKDDLVLCPASWFNLDYVDDFSCVINSALRYAMRSEDEESAAVVQYLRRHYQLFDEKTLSVAVADLERELNQPIVTLKQPQVWKELQELFRQRLDELRKESSEGEETHHG